ncbi:condensin complex subunit 2 [Paragonimus westermani]|uniref:Condensin complex subunit 2 n=1 Tax=Paragonimus westermani TaxID=34504 RepID=A0A5J4NLJ5_9TREM|nr:condensin complex subunit 2 [Paragonimus westermani]
MPYFTVALAKTWPHAVLKAGSTLLNVPHEPVNEMFPGGSSEDSLAPQMRDHDGDVAIVEPSRPDISTTATDGDLFVSSLKSMLDKQYEHFGQINDHILGMWAGPEHWRKKAKRRRFDPVTGLEINSGLVSFDDDLDVATDKPSTETTQAVGKSRRSRRNKRNAPVVDYETAKEPSENRTRNGHLARKTWVKTELSEGVPKSAASNATLYKEATRLKASRQMNLLPSEWVDTRNTLYQLYNREVILGSHPGLHTNQLPVAFDAPETVNLAPPHNNPEFCGMVSWLDRPQLLNAATDTMAVPRAHLDDVDGPPGSPACIVDDDDDDLPLPFEFTTTQPANTQGDFGDMELIFQPRKVARIEIGYARTAKMINVGRLKSAMWNFLELAIAQSNVAPQSPVSVASTFSAPEAASLPASLTSEAAPTLDFPELPFVDSHRELRDERHCSGRCNPPRLSDLIDNLPTRLSWQMTKELSVPIVLNCLLHLANEKELYLSCSEDLTDIIIFQGVPYFELESLKTYQTARGCDDSDYDSASKRTSRPTGAKQKKVKRPRSSALDSWLLEPDNGAHSPR